MGRALVAVGAALILCFAGFGAVIYFTRIEDRIAVDNLLAEDLTRAIGTAEENTDGRVDLRKVANFPWEQVVLVAPGTPDDGISEELSFEWKGDRPFGDGELLIFLAGGKLLRFADYRGEGVFDRFPRPFARITRDDGVLRVRNLIISPA